MEKDLTNRVSLLSPNPRLHRIRNSNPDTDKKMTEIFREASHF